MDSLFGKRSVAQQVSYKENSQTVQETDNKDKTMYPEVLKERKINLEFIANQAMAGRYYIEGYQGDFNRKGPYHFPGGQEWIERVKRKEPEEIDNLIEGELVKATEQAQQEQKDSTPIESAVNFFGRVIPATEYDISSLKLQLATTANTEQTKESEKTPEIVTLPDGSRYTKEFVDLWDQTIAECFALPIRLTRRGITYMPPLAEFLIERAKNYCIFLYTDNKDIRFVSERERPFRKEIRKKRIAKMLKKKYGICDDKDDLSQQWTETEEPTWCSKEYLETRQLLVRLVNCIAENEYADEFGFGYRVYDTVTEQNKEAEQFSDTLSAEDK